ncbi:MAG: DNA translocase FtsK 4TM domain-containing protein [Bacteroidaceae bacterium]|nr:DNA translocase FtsK 4TM domain-containing protein [Bacteroidaceae bacterium]
MGLTKKDNKPRTGTQKPERKFSLSNISDTFRNETFLFTGGAVLTVIAIFAFGAYISFLFNGGTDQSAVSSGIGEITNKGGNLGAKLAEFMVNGWFGLPSVLIPVFLTACGLNMMRITHFKLVRWFVSCTFLMVWLSVFLHWSFSGLGIFKNSFLNPGPGGTHGMNATNFLCDNIGVWGLILLLVLTMLLYCIYLTRRTIEFIRGGADRMKQGIRRHDKAAETEAEPEPEIATTDSLDADEANNPDDDPYATAPDFTLAKDEPEIVEKPAKPAPAEKPETPAEDIKMTITAAGEDEKADGKIQEPYDPRLDLSHYKFPTLDLLKHYDNDAPAIDEKEQEANKNRIIKVLLDFGIEIETINATVGPTITLYEITPAAGVRISKIRNLEADIALSLAALGIRIIAPIPGKGTIGIEVPNAKPVMVSMESILNSKKFAESKMELPVALGRTITNEVFMFDLAKMPHLLVAGATGQGKSVGLNAVITSLLYKKHPAELKLVMVDPKMVEFSIYAPIIKHFLAKMPDETDAIITDTTKVIHTLKSLCIEMDNRYELLKDANVRSVIEYNNLFKDRKLNPEKGHRYLPYIVVVIDEFGDLIMTAGKDIEMPIARIAQKARAVGIHMIIATQRPTTNIITGTIKANFPARMAFRVSSMIDSRTILDRPGANQLIGRGDLLFLSGSDPVRVQCAFVDTPEVNAICQYISRQQGYTEAYPLPEYVDENEGGGMDSGVEMGKFDPMFAEAARLVVVNQSGSTSLIQRKFAIGYNRAGRLMDQLEAVGIVGKADGSKPRPVLVTDEVQLDRILETYNIQ